MPVGGKETGFLLDPYPGKSKNTEVLGPLPQMSYLVLAVGPKLGAHFYGEEEGSSISVTLDVALSPA